MVKKIFSGVQPTGNLHLGNYLGAIKNFVDLSNETENECVFCVVDLHAITVNQDPKKLRDNIRETVATFVASGIDPKRSVIFNQSQVSAHSEAAWILSCVARMGWLNRMTQFKEKAGKDKEKASVGLYSYPILMAADILLYDTTHVPVGDDQKQHLELCRDIAQKFNNDFQVEDFFKVPEPLIQKEFSRIMSLKDGTKKMSKSELSDLSRINLTDDKDQIINKVKKDHPLYSESTDGRGIAYERIGDWNKAEKDLLASLEADPNQAYVINYLAYSWIEQGVKIEKSLNMLEKANKLRSNDPYITDSLGWALFKLKRYKESKDYLQLAVKLMPGDPIVNDHYGDVLWKNGKEIQARYYWNYVLNLKKTEEELKKTIEQKLIKGI